MRRLKYSFAVLALPRDVEQSEKETGGTDASEGVKIASRLRRKIRDRHGSTLQRRSIGVNDLGSVSAVELNNFASRAFMSGEVTTILRVGQSGGSGVC